MIPPDRFLIDCFMLFEDDSRVIVSERKCSADDIFDFKIENVEECKIDGKAYFRQPMDDSEICGGHRVG